MSRVPLDTARALAQEVLSRVEHGTEIRIARSSFSSEPPVHHAALDVTIELSMGVNYVDQSGVVCSSHYAVMAAPPDDDGDQPAVGPGWKATVEVHGFWLLSSQTGLLAAHAQAFGLAVGAMALHPYARAHVQSMAVAANYPPFTLGVLNSLMEPDPEDNLVDLGAVQFLEGS